MSPTRQFGPISVLIVDDIPSTVDNLQKLLSFESDIKVVGTALNGKEGVKQARLVVPDVVLMGVHMPIMDGIRATKLLGRMLPSARVLLMSAASNTPDRLPAFWRAGAFDFLSKPFSGDELVDSIHFVRGLASEQELPVFRAIGRVGEGMASAQQQTPGLTARLTAWQTLVQMRYAAAWARQARIDPFLVSGARAKDQEIGAAMRIAQQGRLRAVEAAKVAEAAWRAAQQVLNRGTDQSIAEQYAKAAEAHQAAKSAAEEVIDAVSRVKPLVSGGNAVLDPGSRSQALAAAREKRDDQVENLPRSLIRVVIVDDIPSTLDNLQKLLSFEPDIEVVGTAVNGLEGVGQVKQLAPDIVLMDINMPVMDGIQATGLLTRETPESRVIAMAVQTERDYLQRALQNGAREALGKPFSGDELIACIRRVVKDQTHVQAQPLNYQPASGQPRTERSNSAGKLPKASTAVTARVLILEDIPVHMRLAKHLLEKYGFEVHTATSAGDCLTKLAEILPDILVTDIQHPGEDGLALARRLRSDRRTADLTIVACTVHSMPGDREKILAAGCDGYIQKPIEPTRFADEVAGYLRQRRLTASTAAGHNANAVSIANEQKSATTSLVGVPRSSPRAKPTGDASSAMNERPAANARDPQSEGDRRQIEEKWEPNESTDGRQQGPNLTSLRRLNRTMRASGLKRTAFIAVSSGAVAILGIKLGLAGGWWAWIVTIPAALFCITGINGFRLWWTGKALPTMMSSDAETADELWRRLEGKEPVAGRPAYKGLPWPLQAAWDFAVWLWVRRRPETRLLATGYGEWYRFVRFVRAGYEPVEWPPFVERVNALSPEARAKLEQTGQL